MKAGRAAWRWREAFPFLALLALLSFPPASQALGSPEERLRQACNTCRGIADRFTQGLTDTAKKNFGGGNTAWEEKTLSRYESSEIRLVEIIENLCDSSNFECNNMVEEHEEHIETWWFKRSHLLHLQLKKRIYLTTSPDSTTWDQKGRRNTLICLSGFVLKQSKFAALLECMDQTVLLVVGDQKGLVMEMAIVMEMALELVMDHAGAKRNIKENSVWTVLMDSTTLTKMIHTLFAQLVMIHVKHVLGQPTKTVKIVKKVGSEMKKPVFIFSDVDECAVEESPCNSDQYCLNTDGSFSCKACDLSCLGCTGEGPNKCKNCVTGYEMKEETCTDVDECSHTEEVCTGENTNCINTPGGYKCICSEGFEDKDGICVPSIKAEEKTSANISSSDTHEDL